MTAGTLAGTPVGGSGAAGDGGELYSLSLRSTAGDDANTSADWRVVVHLVEDGTVTRTIWSAAGGKQETLWKGDDAWQPELTIWPCWHQLYNAADGHGAAPLETVTKHCSRNGERLRESAKWMATVVGLAMAALIGTSPLSDMRRTNTGGWTFTLGLAGLALLVVTLLLILSVIRPRPLSYHEIQAAVRGPLHRWRKMVESEQDLYLPCGIICLRTLRQTMIVDELTLNVLAGAINLPGLDPNDKEPLEMALKGRLARLIELRRAAAQIVAIADYYQLHRRSTIATYLGGICATIGTAAIVAAFLV